MAVAIERDPSRRVWQIYVIRPSGFGTLTGHIRTASGEWVEFDENSLEPLPPTYVIDDMTMTELIEEVGKHGVRADQGTTGKLTATEAHLEDLRRLLGLGEKQVHPCVR